ncbi:MAG TPA: hypothetical protein VIW78_13220 [Burkholderiales bacterium]
MRFAALIVVLLAGCATSGGGLTEATDSWNGATYDEVVLRWGTPVRNTKLNDGRDVYTWVSDGTFSRGSVSPSVGIGIGSGGMVGMGTGVMFGPGGGEPVRCERTLFFKAGRVDEQNWQGPTEYCRSFGRSAR